MAIYLSNRDGGKTDEQGHYKFQTNAFTGNVLDGGLLVTQNSPLAMNVKVSGGDARIPYSDYAYTAWIPAGAPETVTVTTANPSNPRIDRLVMYIDRGATPSSATANNPTLCKLMLVAGTPAGSPSRPSNGTVDTAVSNNPYIDLADILVGTGVTQITNANITRTATQIGSTPADGSVTPDKLNLSSTDANGWTVMDFGDHKVAWKSGTIDGGSRAAGATWSAGYTSNLPVGCATVADIKNVSYAFRMTGNAYALGINMEKNTSSTDIGWSAINNAAGTVDFGSPEYWCQVIF